jgi:HAD superfamily hydrolase (TIGR01549 family)
MTKSIDAILFDMGGTLRGRTMHDREIKRRKFHTLVEILGAQVDEPDFRKLLKSRAKEYKEWAEKTLLELNEVDLWTKWMLPDWPAEQVAPFSIQLNQIWRDITGVKTPFPETREVVLELYRRGYRLGLVSNTTSSTEAPKALKELGIWGCFDTIILSCDVGIRKPNPEIMLLAARRMGVSPQCCAYVGDQPRRDAAAARGAGFSQSIILRNQQNMAELTLPPDVSPDRYIDNLTDLLRAFPPLSKKDSTDIGNNDPKYNASLSTMWAVKNFTELSDFFLASRRLGFSGVELNHAMNTQKMSGVNLDDYSISSIHEPCPADISTDTLKLRDWLISSTDQDCRAAGVEAIKRSIALAGNLSVKTLVVHCGSVLLDTTLEKKLRQLFKTGKKDSVEYLETKTLMLATRQKLASACMKSVVKSLKELLKYAGKFGVRLGLENRYHYYDIPTQDEMETFLAMDDPNRIGFIYDIGHGTAMDRLGFFNNEDWLKRFGERIFGVHLHDVIGVEDHFAPGSGDADFRMIARYLPTGAFKTIEVMSFNSPEQIKNGMRVLVDSGCVSRIN